MFFSGVWFWKKKNNCKNISLGGRSDSHGVVNEAMSYFEDIHVLGPHFPNTTRKGRERDPDGKDGKGLSSF